MTNPGHRPPGFPGIEVAYKGRNVWSAELIALRPNSKFCDPREPYIELIFNPGEGVNPPESQ
jgi:hypothetical protein